jgi:hypothetical protein
VKEVIKHCFYLEKIEFNPNASFVANLWNCVFFWILRDLPSGVSIFFCPETTSLNAAELEKNVPLLWPIKSKQGILKN